MAFNNQPTAKLIGSKKKTSATIVDLTVHQDSRGYLYEVIHDSDAFVFGEGEHINQVYVVGDPAPLTVRAFHRHKKLHDWFSIIHGSAKFVLVEELANGSIIYDEYVLSPRNQQLLVVPPGVYHGWMSLEPDTILLSCASHEYNREEPDEERVPPWNFGDVIGHDIWCVESK